MTAFQIPINKGNYSMETPEREKLYQDYLAEGWESGYKQYRENWIKYAKEQYVSEYPLLVDIETSSLCNLHCPMCFSITDDYKKKVNATLIDEALFYKIIDEISGKVHALRLSWRGEPTLHPKLVDFVRYAKQKGIKEISFLTNGSRLNEEYFTSLIEAGIDWVTISVDGTGAIYESIRKPVAFQKIFDIIKSIKKIKEKMQVYKPVIKVQSIWPAIRENPEEYYNAFAPYVDLVAFNPLIDYLANDMDIVYVDDFSCPQIYQRIFIAADGLALGCSNDERNDNVIGDVNRQSIYDIWHGEKLEAIRKLHKMKDGYKDIHLCKRCYLPRATEDNEVAVVNGREFIIKNYINRSQIIGE